MLQVGGVIMYSPVESSWIPCGCDKNTQKNNKQTNKQTNKKQQQQQQMKHQPRPEGFSLRKWLGEAGKGKNVKR